MTSLYNTSSRLARPAQVTLMALVSTALQNSRAVVTALQSPASGSCSQTPSGRAADPHPKGRCKGHALPCAMCHKPLLHASSDSIRSKCSDGHSIASLPVSCVKSLLHAISCEGVAMRDQGSHIDSLILHHFDAHRVCSSQQGSSIHTWDSATQKNHAGLHMQCLAAQLCQARQAGHGSALTVMALQPNRHGDIPDDVQQLCSGKGSLCVMSDKGTTCCFRSRVQLVDPVLQWMQDSARMRRPSESPSGWSPAVAHMCWHSERSPSD